MRLVICIATAFFMLHGCAWGEVNRSWEELMQTVKVGESIVVTRTNSANLAGELEQITPEAVTVKWQGGTKLVPRAEVYRVKTASRRARRATIGAVGAGASCFVVFGILASRVFTDPGENTEWASAAAAGALCAGIGAGIGAAMPGQKTLYESDQPRK